MGCERPPAEPQPGSPALLAVRGESIICFAGEDWWYHNPHSNRHLMEAFARAGNRVVFVNSTGIRTPSVLSDRHSWRRVGRKLRSLAIYLRRAEPDLFVLTPFALPITRRWRSAVWRINQFLIVAQTRIVGALLGLSRPILWTASPASSAAALSMRRKWARLLVYYCTDNIAFFRGADTEFIKTLDATLQDRADITFFTGRRLFGERARARTETHLLSHGVDYSLFAQTQNPNGTVPAELEGLRQPVVGFVGAITGLDLDLIEKVARAHPNVSFVFIGTLLMDVTPLRAVDNVRFLGFRPYAVLPDYLRWFRCCIICYRRGDPFNDYRSPKKLLEYFATGHPLVSVELAELEGYGPLVYRADTAEQFAEQLQRALAESDPQLRQLRIEAAAARDWSVVAAEAAQHIARCLDQRGVAPGVISSQLPHSST